MNEIKKESLLEKIDCPADLKKLDNSQLKELSKEIRSFLVENVAHTGGHLASNLGVVELTIAIHRVFDTSRDRLVFDVGHQSYVHKMLTGRRRDFENLRRLGGISGFPKPSESIHDAFVAGHASAAISVALGMARARTLTDGDYSVIALVGDGALTGGMAYEGLNDAGQSGEPIIVILNDNGMSIRQNVGGLSRYLARIRVKSGYFQFKKMARTFAIKFPGGRTIYNFFASIKEKIKFSVLNCRLFEDMGFYYIGPVDGEDIPKLEYLLKTAREMGKPVLLHVNTVKGKGYSLSEKDPENYHGVSGLDSHTGAALKSSKKSFSDVFGDELCTLAEKDKRIAAISAAMIPGTGLDGFSKAFPDRCFDVAIAEEHAVSMAAGMAKQGIIPVFAVYSTFLQRAYDQIMQDVSILRLHVVFAVDRAGLVGEDGETHHGVYDQAFLKHFPGMTVYAPSNNNELRSMLDRAVYECTGPVAVRYPRGSQGAFAEDTSSYESRIVKSGKRVSIVTYGRLINQALSAAAILEERGISAQVIKVNTLCPLNADRILDDCSVTGRVLVVEEAVDEGSLGERLSAVSASEGRKLHIITKNLGNDFVGHGSVVELFGICGIDDKGIVKSVLEGFAFERE